MCKPALTGVKERSCPGESSGVGGKEEKNQEGKTKYKISFHAFLPHKLFSSKIKLYL
jgi:hypothetical protein